MEPLKEKSCINLVSYDLESLAWGQIKPRNLLNQHSDKENVVNKQKRRKLSDYSFLNELKLRDQRTNCGKSTKNDSLNQSKISSDSSFRSVKQRILHQEKKRRQKQKSAEFEQLQPWQLQDMGYLTFKMLKQKTISMHDDASKTKKVLKQGLKQVYPRRRTAGL